MKKFWKRLRCLFGRHSHRVAAKPNMMGLTVVVYCEHCEWDPMIIDLTEVPDPNMRDTRSKELN